MPKLSEFEILQLSATLASSTETKQLTPVERLSLMFEYVDLLGDLNDKSPADASLYSKYLAMNR